MNRKLSLFTLVLSILFLLQISGCSDNKTTDRATLIFSSSLISTTYTNTSTIINNEKQKTGVHKVDPVDITSISITVTDTEGQFSATELMVIGETSLSFSVPASTNLVISGKAFQDDSLSFLGGSIVKPIQPGTSQNVSFLMYSANAEPVLVDIGLANKSADGPSTGTSLSQNQNYVLFTSAASNLVEEDNNGATDLFLRDLNSNKIIKINASSDGTLAAVSEINLITETAISADGRYVVFTSASDNLVADDTNQVSDVFLKDTLTGETKRISLKKDNLQTEKASYQPDISNDGQKILFYSDDALLNNGGGRLYFYDRITQQLSASISNAKKPRLSGDGNSFVYVDAITGNLDLLNSVTGSKITIISTDIEGSATPQSKVSFEYELNFDGQYIVLVVNEDTALIKKNQVYLYDRGQADLILISANNELALNVEDNNLRNPSISNDGKYVVFRFNGTIYIKDVASNLLEPIADGLNPFLSLDGQRIGYTDILGRVVLQDNPLYSLVANAPTIPLERPSQLSASVDIDTDKLNINWQPIENSKYYRVSIATETGVTPSNYFLQENGLQVETIDSAISIPLNFADQGNVYVVISVVNDEGEGLPSDELQVSLPLEIVDVFPENNAINIPISIQPKITFNRDLDASSVDAKLFYISDDDLIIEGEIIFPDSRSISFVPAEPLLNGLQYQLYISGLTDVFGIALDDVQQMNFTVVPAVVVNASVNLSITGEGTVTPAQTQIIVIGDMVNFNLMPALGYRIGSVIGCDGTLVENVYTTNSVLSDCTVTVNFVIDRFSLTYSAIINGSLNGILSQTVDYGSSGSAVSAAPATGYSFVNWSDGRTDNPRTDINVTNNVSVSASFTPISYTVNVNVGSGGSVIPSATSFSISYDSTLNLSINPSENFRIGSVAGCNGTLNGALYFSGKITADCTINVSFVANIRPALVYPTSTIPFPENEFDIMTISATDTDTLSFRINGGADQTLFSINPNTGLLSFIFARDFEQPTDANGDNTYEVSVVANDGDLDSNTGIVSVRIRNVQEFGPPLNDTTLIRCAPLPPNITTPSCPGTDFPRQDAEFGNDKINPSPSNGLAGFNFVKLNSNGIELSASASDWSCILDKTTGNIWEVKTPTNRTTLFDWDSAQTYADDKSLCGYSDWRLPTVTELVSIVAYSVVSIPTNPKISIDMVYFKNTYVNFGGYNGRYWTSTEYTNQATLDSAYAVEFRLGSASSWSKTNFKFVRLVRGSQQ